MQPIKMALLIVAPLLALQPASAAGTCGATVLKQDFNKYPGKLQKWSQEAALKDFDIPGPKRASGTGVLLSPGLGFGLGFENCQVGNGEIVLKFPKGALSSCALEDHFHMNHGK
jgi:hypothetical protein